MTETRTPHNWGPAEWLEASAADLPEDRTRLPGRRVRYRIGRSPLLRPARLRDVEPPQ